MGKIKNSNNKRENKKKTKKQKINNILKEYYDWEVENIWINLNKRKCDINRILNQITNKYNNKNQEVEMVKTDTGITVIVLKNIVIRIYKQERYNQIKEIFNIKHPNIENTIGKVKLQNLFFVISEKIIPITIDFKINPVLDIKKINKENIIKDIYTALDEIDESGFIQGDARLDNIGVTIKGNTYTYVIFDFGATTKKNETQRNTENDKKDLIKSINKII